LEWLRTALPPLLKVMGSKEASAASEGDGGLQCMQCMQEAGDVMFVPHGWGHVVVNTMVSVGVAVNFEHPFRTF
jgi:hypothetical protein